MTSGRANNACAASGTKSSASTSGHKMGPPALNACAVEPVAVEITTPSHPNVETGLPSTSTAISTVRRELARSTVASLSAQPVSVVPSGRLTSTSSVPRSSTV